jgi:hydrogenase nickel incorporation protein HypA/HybF
MHELSIAFHVIETLTAELADVSGRVESVRLAVGAFSGVVPSAIRRAWDIATDGSRLAGSSLEIDEIALRIWCDLCEREQAIPDVAGMRCPICGQPPARIVAGQELEILSVEMVDCEAAEAH